MLEGATWIETKAFTEEDRSRYIMNSAYTLANVEQTAAEHPDTFGIPPREARYNAKVGDMVKLTLRCPVEIGVH
jgi:hypothetical protein